MATDYDRLSANLCRFYDFTGKTVLYVGAGTKQLLDISARPKKLIAIDKDPESLRDLQANIVARGLQNSMQVVGASFEEVTTQADVVYFEFCLHEMEDPEKALHHAKSLAPEVVVYDHSVGSEWIFYGVEEDKVARSTAAMARLGIRQRETFEAVQRFATYDELLAKLSPQGLVALDRAQRFAGATDIVIPMPYELNLL